MAASAYYTQVQNMYVAYFGRPADKLGLEYYAKLLDKNGGNDKAMLHDFANSTESKGLYNQTALSAKIAAMYQILFGRAADTDGVLHWASEVQLGKVILSEVAAAIAYNAQPADRAIYEAKLTAAAAFTAKITDPAVLVAYETDPSQGRTWLATVKDTATATAAQATINATLAAVVAGVDANAGQTFTLTENADDLTGTTGNDTFVVGEKLLGLKDDGTPVYASKLQATDKINGGAGIDTLKIATEGAIAKVSPTMSGVELVELASGAAVAFDVSAYSDVDTVKSTKSTTVTLTAGTENNIAVSGASSKIEARGGKNVSIVDSQGVAIDVEDTKGDNTGTYTAGTINVTSTKQAGDIAIDGGTDVTVNATSAVATGKITVGDNKAASGAVNVTQNLTVTKGEALDNTAAGNAIYVEGGKTVNVTINASTTATKGDQSGAMKIGSVAVLGDGKTTDVTVKETKSVTTFTDAKVEAVKATQTVTFKALAIGEKAALKHGGNELVFTATKALTADQVAAAFAALTKEDTQDKGGPTANGYYTGTFPAAWSSASVNGATVSFTAAAHDTTALLVGDGATADKVTVNTLVAGTAASGGSKSTNSIAFGTVDIQDNATAAIKNVTIDGFASAKVGVSGTADDTKLDALTNLSLANNTAGGDVDVATAATSLNLTVNKIVNNAGNAAVVNLDHDGNVTAAGSKTIKTLTINAEGAASKLQLNAEALETLTVNAAVALDISTNAGKYATAALTTVDVNGAGAVNLGDISAAKLKTFNAADNTGGVTATVSAKTADLDATFTKYVFSAGKDTVVLKDVAVNKAIELGAGDDKITLATGVRIADVTATIDGGAGTNTLVLAADDAESLSGANTFNAKIDNFQRLTIGNAASQEVVNLDNIDGISYVTLGSSSATAQVATITVGGTIEVGDIFTVTVNGTTYSFTAANTVVADIVAGLRAAVNTGAPAGITVGAAGATTFTLTASTAGMPFTATVATTEAGGGTADAQTLAIAPTTPNAYGITLDNLANNGTVSLTDSGSVLVSVKGAAEAGRDADVLNIITAGDVDLGYLTVNKVETVNISTTQTYDADGKSNEDWQDLVLVADTAAQVNVSGAGNLDLVTQGNALKLVDAATMTGELEYTASVADLVVKGGSGADDLTAAANDVKLYGGAGNDQLTVTSGLRVNLYGGEGKDTFVFASGASSTLDAYAIINGVESGDVIQMASATAFKQTKVTLSTGADDTLLNYANQAIKSVGSNEMAWFQKGGNTYIVQDLGTNEDAFKAGEDMIVMITGLVDLSAASFNTSNILEIA